MKVKVIIMRAPHPPSILMSIMVEAGTSNILESEMSQLMRLWYLSHRRRSMEIDEGSDQKSDISLRLCV